MGLQKWAGYISNATHIGEIRNEIRKDSGHNFDTIYLTNMTRPG